MMTQSNLWRRLLALFLAIATVSSLALEGAALSLSPEETSSDPVSDQQAEDTESAGDGELDGAEIGTPGESESTEPAEPGDTPDAGELDEPAVPAEPSEPAAPDEPAGPVEPTAPEEGLQEPTEPEEGTGQDDPEQSEPEEEQPGLEETDDSVMTAETLYGLRVTATKTLTLSYDDRYSFTSLAKDYVILSIRTNQVTSYQVSRGSKTSTRDKAVLQTDGDSTTDIVATGVGTATVLLVPEDQLEHGTIALAAEEAQALAEEAEQVLDEMPGTGLQTASVTEIPAIQVNVTVQPAKLTMMFLAGQSNMEGYCSGSTGYHREDSVACPTGEVYSTYAPTDSVANLYVGGVAQSEYSTDPNVLVAGSLTGTTNRNGTKLAYPLNALTKQGPGKTGPDSGLAYEWNRLTGDKVWVINAAWGGSKIQAWNEGGAAYTKALSVYEAAIETLEAEISAGHYTKGNRLLFWLQGESDRYLTAEAYLTAFQSMKSDLVSSCGIEYFGLIAPRSSQGSYLNGEDIYMNGPRIAQYYMANSANAEYKNVYVVSNVNEQWISDSGVQSYFRSAYPSGKLTYPLRSTTTLSGLPTTVRAIHGDVHYSQVGHNENGLTAARNMYYIVKNKRPTSTVSVSWRNSKGVEIGQTLSLFKNTTETVVPVVEPLYNAKRVSVQAGSSVVSYTQKNGLLTGVSVGTTVLQAKNSSGKTVSSLSVKVAELAVPQLTGAQCVEGGIQVKWGKVTGATGYLVYHRTAGTGWTRIATLSGGSVLSYVDTNVKHGQTYSYTVIATYGSFHSGYDTVGCSATYLTAPAVTALKSGSNGITLTWNAVSGCTGYRVYRKTSSTSWQRLATVSGTSYTDTEKHQSGTTYIYTLRACKGSSISGYHLAGYSICYLDAPKLTGAQSLEGSVQVKWGKVTGATGYRVYRRTAGTSWTRIAVLSGGSTLSYADTNVKHGQTYIYTVVATNGSSLSSYDTAGCSVTYLTAPTVTALKNGNSGIALTWTAVSGCTGYRVYRKTSSTSWQFLATVSGTSYTDTGKHQSGTTYIYTLRACKGSSISGYHLAGYSICYLDTPTVSALSNTSSGISLTWNRVSGATSYQICRKSGSSGWSWLATVTGTSYLDQTATTGTTYTYTIFAVNGANRSDYNHTGFALRRLTTPVLLNAKAAASGITLTWNRISGASSYHVYRKSGSSGWSRVATVTGTSYLDQTAAAGTTYTYTVRAAWGGQLSDYDRIGLSAKAK